MVLVCRALLREGGLEFSCQAAILSGLIRSSRQTAFPRGDSNLNDFPNLAIAVRGATICVARRVTWASMQPPTG